MASKLASPDEEDFTGTPRDWETAQVMVSGEYLQTNLERHKKYGPKNIANFGLVGIVLRINDKAARLKAAIEQAIADPPEGWNGDLATLPLPDEHVDDTVEDALKDISNYGVIGGMWLRGWWHLPLRESRDKVKGMEKRDGD